MTEPKLVLIRGIKPVHQSVVHLLQEALDLALQGEVVAAAVIYVSPDQTVTSGYTGGHSYHYLNSGAARLAARLARED